MLRNIKIKLNLNIIKIQEEWDGIKCKMYIAIHSSVIFGLFEKFVGLFIHFLLWLHDFIFFVPEMNRHIHHTRKNKKGAKEDNN